MTNDQLLAEIREANMTYLMLAQNLIRQDKAQALFRLGLSEESADLIAALSPARLGNYFELELLGHEGDHVGLRDGLAGPDRKRAVAIGGASLQARDELMARNLAHRRQHARIDLAGAALAPGLPRQRDDLVYHLPPLVGAIIFRHGRGAHQQDQQK